MSRRRYLVTYDIADDKRRTVTFNTLKDFGEHLQYSVFLCDLNDRERIRLRGLLGEAVNHREDQILIVDLGQAEADIVNIIGSIGKDFTMISRTMVV
ncbi:MAG: CRISPR-associated endonuclease Cas2 [Planctomycetes bacterium]|nr:CRISPR-associated endonuclease Cas2 [Planctomycetota bacterium]